MGKLKKVGIYVLCILCGVYTADMIFRIIRYISAANGDMFSKTIMVLGTIFLDGGSFMILSLISAVLIFAVAVWLGTMRKRTLTVFAVNIISCAVFMIVSNMTTAHFTTVMYVTVICLPVYLLSGLWCIYFSVKDLCRYFLNNTNEETNK